VVLVALQRQQSEFKEQVASIRYFQHLQLTVEAAADLVIFLQVTLTMVYRVVQAVVLVQAARSVQEQWVKVTTAVTTQAMMVAAAVVLVQLVKRQLAAQQVLAVQVYLHRLLVHLSHVQAAAVVVHTLQRLLEVHQMAVVLVALTASTAQVEQ
jgi:hypothetical protein